MDRFVPITLRIAVPIPLPVVVAMPVFLVGARPASVSTSVPAQPRSTLPVSRIGARPLVLLIALLCATLGPTPAPAYDVSAGTTENTIRLQIDDRVHLLDRATLSVVLEDVPDWIVCAEPQILYSRVVEIVVPFDVEDAALGRRGVLALRIVGRADGRAVFDQVHRIDLTVTPVAAPVQRRFAIDECCLEPSPVDETTAPLEAPRLLGAHPNPVRGITNIVFAIPTADSVRLRIFDVQGRRIRELETPRLGPGYHRISWDGRDEAGRDVSPGVYFYDLTSDSWTGTSKLEVLR